MGIDEDWGVGIPMTSTGESGKYTTTIQGFTVGDLIKYNYRVGNNWENQSVEPRSYSVAAGENLVQDAFGSFPSGQMDPWAEEVALYPNPVTDQLTMEGLGSFHSLEIYNAAGKLIEQHSLHGTARIQVEMTHKQAGLYLVKLYGTHQKNLFLKLLKY
jgi:hypothetical protein